MAHKTINASEATYEIVIRVKEDAEKSLGIDVSISDAVLLACSAYFDLKKLKVEAKARE